MSKKEKLPSEIISDFIELMRSSKDKYTEAKKIVDELDYFERRKWWAHQFEFAPNKSERNKLATAYQQERKRRREYKDTVDLYKVLNEFDSNNNNKPTLKRLNGMLTAQMHQEEYLASDREYKGKGGECSENENSGR